MADVFKDLHFPWFSLIKAQIYQHKECPSSQNFAHLYTNDKAVLNRLSLASGNPQRYESRGVVRMGHSQHPYKDQRLEAPVEDIETEGERQLRELVKRQLEKDVTTEGQLSRKKTFQTSSLMKPLTSEISGSMTLGAFRDLETHDRRLEELRHFGLTQEEIQLTLEADGIDLHGKPIKRSRYGIDPAAHSMKLKTIQDKIEKKREELKKPDQFTGARHMSRHEMELERAISHNSDKSNLLGMLMTRDSKDLQSQDPSDPINNLDSIMEEVREKASRSRMPEKVSSESEDEDPVASCKPRPVGYQSKNDIPVGFLCPLCRLSIPNFPKEEDFLSNSEVRECCNCHGRFNEAGSVSSDNCNTRKGHRNAKTAVTETKEEAQKSVKKDPRKPEKMEVESIPEDVIKRYKLTVDEIKELPRFKDYDPGEPSKTLYLKNLSAKVTEDDLVALFGRFQTAEQSPILYRMMTGRMRGQAFITFSCAEIASDALQLVNGYGFRGKHIIIQYGRK